MLREMGKALEGRILQRKRTHKKSNLMLVHFRVPQFVPKDTSATLDTAELHGMPPRSRASWTMRDNRHAVCYLVAVSSKC